MRNHPLNVHIQSLVKKTGIGVFSMLFVLVSMSCTSDNFEIAPNGNPYLRSLEFRDGMLIPSFDPKVYEYSLLIPESMPVWAKYQGYVFTTRPFLNGSFCRINTNEYGFPDYTDITRFITNELLIIDSIAADGMKRTYRIQLLGSMHDATTMTKRSTNSVGIMSLDAFSMPPLTPRMITKRVRQRIIASQKIGRKGSVEKL